MPRPSNAIFSSIRARPPCPIHGPSRPIPSIRPLPVRRSWTRPRCRKLSTLSAREVQALIPSLESMGLKPGDPVTVAMSGGVDSSVVLRLLMELPLEIQVVFMRNWNPLLSESALPERPGLPHPSPRHHARPSSPLSSSSSSSSTTIPTFSASSSSAPPFDPSSPAHTAPGPSTLAYSPLGSASAPAAAKQPDLRPCAWESDYAVVRSVCAHVGVPASRVRMADFSREYWTQVWEPALQMWEDGGTPNPDVGCNREIKFGALLDSVGGKGALATGHYVQILRPPLAPFPQLHRAVDRGKDQSYYLSSITATQLGRAVCPLGGMTKATTRALAEYWDLPNKARAESMGICFVGERGRFGDFVSQYMSDPPEGWLIDSAGRRLKRHEGLWRYTIGQRAKLAGQGAAWYVAQKGVGETGQDVLAVPGHDNPYLYTRQVTSESFHWIHGVPAPLGPGGPGWMRARAQVVSRAQAVPCSVRLVPGTNGVHVQLDSGIHGCARGQVLALADDDWILGSGLVLHTVSDGELEARREMESAPATSHGGGVAELETRGVFAQVNYS